MKRLRVGILGATGAVGRQFLTLLHQHPWFEVAVVAASARSAGRPLDTVLAERHLPPAVDPVVGAMDLRSVTDDASVIAEQVDLVFSAMSADAAEIRAIEEQFASLGAPVISNNSAHRWTEDVPVIIPEINPDHAALIDQQRQRRGWTTGLIVAKPNCSIQSYVPVVTALAAYQPTRVRVVSMQAVSGAGKTLEEWPEMQDNIIPFISGEEEKSMREPMKIWGKVTEAGVTLATMPQIEATCVRVPVENGHMASMEIECAAAVSQQQIIDALEGYRNPIAELGLPSAPAQLIRYMTEDDRPQTRLDRDYAGGMGVSVGRLRQTERGWTCIALSHNTVRGAAGGAVLTAELLVRKGYIGSDG